VGGAASSSMVYLTAWCKDGAGWVGNLPAGGCVLQMAICILPVMR